MRTAASGAMEMIARKVAKCCVCQRPPESIETWNQPTSDAVRVEFRCDRPGHLRHERAFSVDVDPRLLELQDRDRFWASPAVWWLQHPFPRSVARFGEVSALARRERRRRMAGR